MTRLLILLLTGAALTAAGCGGDDEGSGGGASEPSSKPSSSGSAPKTGALEIKMENFQFDPKSATVKVGQQVKWVNQDTADHNVIDEKTDLFKSDQFGRGGSFTFSPKKAGTIDYVCTLHPGMTAKLTVTR
jgi:plastocyanin